MGSGNLEELRKENFMSLIYRIKRLVKSDLHAFVEGIEEKKWVLAQAIRDMEEELDKLGKETEARRSQTAQLSEKIKTLEGSRKTLESDVDFAMQEKREEIAKPLIKKLLLNEQNLSTLREDEKNSRRELSALEADFQGKKEKYDEVCARAESLHLERVNDDVFTSAGRLVPQDTCLEHQVELEFLRRLQKIKGVES